jgi:MFS family permease
MAGEWTDPGRRGFTTSFAQLGAPAGMVLANGAVGVMTLVTDDAAFLEWGWRVPFLASIALIGVGFWIRMRVMETPVFEQIKAEGRIARTPVAEVLRRNWREVVLTALLRTGQQVPFYIFTTFIVTYATQRLGLTRTLTLNLVMLMALICCGLIPLTGHWSDVIGRRRITAIGCVVMIIFPFVYFQMLDSGSLTLVALAILISLPLENLQYGPQAAFIAEAFPGSLRYSGASLGYQLASITAGGPAPIIATVLLGTYGTSTAIAVYMAICSLISLACVYVLPERAGVLDRQ